MITSDNALEKSHSGNKFICSSSVPSKSINFNFLAYNWFYQLISWPPFCYPSRPWPSLIILTYFNTDLFCSVFLTCYPLPELPPGDGHRWLQHLPWSPCSNRIEVVWPRRKFPSPRQPNDPNDSYPFFFFFFSGAIMDWRKNCLSWFATFSPPAASQCLHNSIFTWNSYCMTYAMKAIK